MSDFTVTVTSTDGLKAAIWAAHSGDTILLAPGAYSELRMDSGVNFDGAGITIASADPLNPAVMAGIRLASASGVNFSNIELTPASDTGFDVYLAGASRMAFDHVNLHGTPGGGGDAAMVRESNNVSITNSQIHDIGTGINHLNSSFINFSDNTFHDIGVDGIRGGGSSNVTINGNSFTNFHPHGNDHPDAIQFWTSNITGVTHDVSVTNNTFTRGDGSPVQGIFIKDEDSQGYKNVTVSGNAVIGELYHGIYVGAGDHMVVSNNLVEGYVGQDSWIFVGNTTNSSEIGNSATNYQGTGNFGLDSHDNARVAAGVIGDTRLLASFLGTPIAPSPLGGGPGPFTIGQGVPSPLDSQIQDAIHNNMASGLYGMWIL